MKRDYTNHRITRICPTCKRRFHPYNSHSKTQKFCQQRCIRRTDEFKRKVSSSMIGVNTWTSGVPRPGRRGKNSNFWRGGVSKINRTERQNFTSTLEYREFRRVILKRDNYTCQICGDRTRAGHRVTLQVDHIKPFSAYNDLRLDVNNARTLCKPCHYKTDTFGSKARYLK